MRLVFECGVIRLERRGPDGSLVPSQVERLPSRARGATTCAEEEEYRAFRVRQTNRAQAVRRTEVTPFKTSDCESGWVCFGRESILAKETRAARLGAGGVGLVGAGECGRAWDSA
jgi:hypothetical protein